MSEIKVNSVKGVGASSAALTIHNSDGTATANLTNRQGKNIVINGDFRIAQRGLSSTATGMQTVDRFAVYNTGVDEAPTQAQADVASGTTPYTLGFRKSLKITNGNQTSGAGAAKYIWIQSIFEGQDFATSGWNYKSDSSFITVSFWVKSSVAQNFYGYVRTIDGSSYLYPFETGSLSADTWTKVTKTISGNSNLQIDNDNGHGFQLNILPYFGSGYTGTINLNTWVAYNSSVRVPDNTTTWYTTNDSTFEITGVQIEVGSVGTSFDFRSFGDELLKCQRYCQKLGASNGTYDCMSVGNAIYNTLGFVPHRLTVTMRSTPSFTLLGSASDFNYTRDGGDYAPTAIVLDQAGRNMVALKVTGSNLSNDEAIRLFNMNTTGGYLFTAEV
jgi:hypothetical protein